MKLQPGCLRAAPAVAANALRSRRSDVQSVLDGIKTGKTDQQNAGDYVPMINPAGQKKLVPKANVAKAKAKGWKLR